MLIIYFTSIKIRVFLTTKIWDISLFTASRRIYYRIIILESWKSHGINDSTLYNIYIYIFEKKCLPNVCYLYRLLLLLLLDAGLFNLEHKNGNFLVLRVERFIQHESYFTSTIH